MRIGDILAPMGTQAEAASPVAFQINAEDNVATLLEAAGPGPVIVRGSAGERQIVAQELIEHGHKIAVTPIEKGANIVKFGVVIGAATCAIREGEWVHLHNCGSRLDERSNSFDVHTGVPEDVRYE
jgi:hypothetical protein